MHNDGNPNALRDFIFGTTAKAPPGRTTPSSHSIAHTRHWTCVGSGGIGESGGGGRAEPQTFCWIFGMVAIRARKQSAPANSRALTPALRSPLASSWGCGTIHTAQYKGIVAVGTGEGGIHGNTTVACKEKQSTSEPHPIDPVDVCIAKIPPHIAKCIIDKGV
jgi:hypothetical protein